MTTLYSKLNVVGLSVLIAGTCFSLSGRSDTTLAKVNGSVITLESFNQRYRENLKLLQAGAPSKETLLEDLIKRELAIQEAKKLGLDRDPKVQEQLNTVLYHALLQKKLNKDFEKIKVSDTEALNRYRKNPEIRTSHIFVGVKPGASKEEEKKSLKVIQNIQNKYLKGSKMSFAEVAQKYSEGPSAPTGGDIDYQPPSQLDPAYYQAARKLRINQVSGIVRSKFGFHIIKLTGIKRWKDVDQPAIKRQLITEKRQRIFDRYMNALQKKSKVVVNRQLLK